MLAESDDQDRQAAQAVIERLKNVVPEIETVAASNDPEQYQKILFDLQKLRSVWRTVDYQPGKINRTANPKCQACNLLMNQTSQLLQSKWLNRHRRDTPQYTAYEKSYRTQETNFRKSLSGCRTAAQ